MRKVPYMIAAILAASAWAPAQTPEGAPTQPPVFGVGVDIVAVDASVVDADGRPVLGLGLGDFRVEVDGKPRRLASVEYVGRDLESPAPPRARPAHFSSNVRTLRGPAGPAAGRSRQHRPGQGPRGAQGRGALPRHPGPRRPCGAGLRAGPRAGHRVHPRGRGRPAGPDGSGGHGGPRRIPRAAGRGRLAVQFNDRTRWEQFLQALCGGLHVGAPGRSARPTVRARWRARMRAARLRRWRPEATLVYRALPRAVPRHPVGPPGDPFAASSASRARDPRLRLGGPGHGVARRGARSRDRRLAGPRDALRAPPRHLLGGRVVQLLGDRHHGRPGRPSRRGSTTSPRKRAGPCCASSVRARWPSSGSRAR